MHYSHRLLIFITLIVPLVAFLVFGTEKVGLESTRTQVEVFIIVLAIHGGVVFLAKVDKAQTIFKCGKRGEKRGYNKHYRYLNIHWGPTSRYFCVIYSLRISSFFRWRLEAKMFVCTCANYRQHCIKPFRGACPLFASCHGLLWRRQSTTRIYRPAWEEIYLGPSAINSQRTLQTATAFWCMTSL